MDTMSLAAPSSHANQLPVIPRRDQLRAAIAQLGGYCDWHVDHTGWVVTLYLPQERTFAGATLEAALAACLVWLTAAAGSGASGSRADFLAARGAAADRA